MKKMVRGILAAGLALCVALSSACTMPGQSVVIGTTNINIPSDIIPASNNLVEKPAAEVRHVSLPSNLRAVFVSPETDFSETDAASMCDDVKSLGMNAVVIQSTKEGKAYFDLDLNSTKPDAVSAAVEAAHAANLRAYVTLDANELINIVIEESGGLRSGFSAAAHKFAIKYGCEGILVTNYYTVDTPEMYAEYLRSGSGIGYENWLYETNRFVMRTISDVIRKTSNSTAVGLMIEDMWANSDSNEEGSDTADQIQSLYDGHCDTKGYIEDDYADFIIVKAYGSTTDAALNFETVVSWWSDLADKNDLNVYVCHLNERIGEYYGWYEDQLLQQLTVMKNLGGSISGSAFNSLSSLMANPLSSTDTLKKFYADQINTNTLFEQLKMTSPAQLDFVTYDLSVKFMGTFDENFDVYFDGDKIKLNDVGNFFFEKDLEVGMNYFTIEHKGKKFNYSIERAVDVLKSAAELGNITVQGGTSLAFSAVAYSGSKVYASVGSQTIELTEKGTTELVDANGSYSEFFGSYTVGDGIIGKEQNLGSVSYYAVYSGIDETMYAGNVTIAAKPALVDKDFDVVMKDQESLGTGEVVGTMEPYIDDEEYITYVKVLENGTDVLDPYSTERIPSNPQYSQMPAGSLDYYDYSQGEFVYTLSGKRYRDEWVTTFSDTGLGYNALTVNSIGDSGGRSFINFTLDHKISFTVNTSQSFVQGYEGPFGVNSFNAQKIYITFDNVTSVTKLPDFDSCTLFSAGEWSTVIGDDGVPKFRLTLTLAQAGIYSGVQSYYDSDGDLMLTFNIPTATLSDKTIVISPGHGMSNSEYYDTGAIGQVTEQEINLAVCKKLEEILEDMGATVYRLPTESVYYYRRDRPKAAREYDADMFLEIHSNSAGNKSAHGTEAYYYTPWSQTLADKVTRRLAACFDNEYGDGTQSLRGPKYSYYGFTVEHGFPSILLEMGFVSNDRECLMMARSDFQWDMAEAIAEGIEDYFARSDL